MVDKQPVSRADHVKRMKKVSRNYPGITLFEIRGMDYDLENFIRTSRNYLSNIELYDPLKSGELAIMQTIKSMRLAGYRYEF